MTALLPPSIGSAAAMHDLMAAEMVAGAAADGCIGAQELVDEINDALGVAFVHRQRARRLKCAAARASLAGEHDVAALVGRFAGEEGEAAQEHEAVANGLIRGTHAFGYLSSEEQRFLKRKKFEEGMSTQQAEQVYDQLLNRLFQVAANFGQDPEGAGFGADDSEAPEVDELDDGSIEAFGEVAEALGGDMPLVFGEDCYESFGRVFKASAKRLKARRARLRKRLKKLTERVEGLEDEGKTGLRVKVLHWRIEQIEKRLAKISSKLKKLSRTGKKVERSEDEADTIQKAEDSAVRSTVEPDIDELPTDPDMLDAMSDDDLLSELEEGMEDLDGFDLEDLEESDDDALGAEIEVFGLSERRKNRMLKRIARLERRLERLQERRRGLFKNIRMRRIQKRLARLKARLARKSGTSVERVEDALVEGPAALPSITPLTTDYAKALTTPTVQAYSSGKDYVDSFFGSANVGKEAERQPFVCFFRRKAEAMGSANVAFGAEESEGFFARLGNFFRTVLVEPLRRFFAPEKREARRQNRQERREKVRAWISERKANIKARRSAARAERKAARSDLSITQKRKQLAKARRGRSQAAKRAAKAAWREQSPAVRSRRKQLAKGRGIVRRRVRDARRSALDGSPRPRRAPQLEQPLSSAPQGSNGLYQDGFDPRWSYQKVGDSIHIVSAPPERSHAVGTKLQPGTAPYAAVADAISSGAAQRVA